MSDQAKHRLYTLTRNEERDVQRMREYADKAADLYAQAMAAQQVGKHAHARILTLDLQRNMWAADALLDAMLERFAVDPLSGRATEYDTYQHETWYMLGDAYLTIAGTFAHTIFELAHDEGWLHEEVEL